MKNKIYSQRTAVSESSCTLRYLVMPLVVHYLFTLLRYVVNREYTPCSDKKDGVRFIKRNSDWTFSARCAYIHLSIYAL